MVTFYNDVYNICMYIQRNEYNKSPLYENQNNDPGKDIPNP